MTTPSVANGQRAMSRLAGMALTAALLALAHFPAEAQGARIGANCRDGTTSTATGSGACSRHGGVASWRYAEAPKTAASKTEDAAKVASLPLSAKSALQVWVNRSSGVYHCPGSRYYGKTKNGYFASESEAANSGKRPAYGRACE